MTPLFARRFPASTSPHFILAFLIFLAGFGEAPAQSKDSPRLQIRVPSGSNGWFRLASSFHSNTVVTLEASTNLAAWQPIGTVHDGFWNFPDASPASGTPLARQRFYRARSQTRVSTNDWKNEVLFPGESFRSTGTLEDIRWVKFALVLADPTRIYYQDSTRFPFHYEFATSRLASFQGMSRAQFDAVSLHRTNQQIVLGTLLYPPGTNYVEYGVQFVGLDPYPPEELARWFELVKATVFASNGAGAFYMPVFEQAEIARTNAAAFAALGVPVASVERWAAVNHVYAPGWAVGRLKFFAAGEIAAAFADGRLQPGDILLTDGVPAETPLVAGIISLSPSTPNSHTAILAASFGIPFVHLPDPAERERVQGLAGRKVILRATLGFNSWEIKVLDVEGELSAPMEEALFALKRVRPIEFTPKKTWGAISASTENLSPSDIGFFGGKAANYGLLRDFVPTNSPPAIAFSFDLWDAFLDQALPGGQGQTLRAEIASRLAPYTNYPPNIPSLLTNLAAIRDLFTRTAAFTAGQKQAITNALTVFNPQRKIRFRSSTNVEDSQHFTGAGLYDSYSGCLLDDLDGDTAGPSWCDAAETNERGVFRAIQRVYASFYNDYAFLERLRHGVDETKVGMGVLVHHSFPDEEELANGVATLRFRNFSGTMSYSGEMVTQLGAESVTNPEGTSLPEVVSVSGFGASLELLLTQHSSRVPLGAYVMGWDADYRGMINLFKAIGQGFRQIYPARNDFHLDFEYKKDVNLGLVVKQVREVPNPIQTTEVTTFLINEPTTLVVGQREAADVFSNHRLKSIWALQTKTMQLASSNLLQGIYTEGRMEYLSNGALHVLQGPLNTWPSASNAPSGSLDYWTTGAGAGAARRDWRLETILITNVSGARPPVVTQQDFTRFLHVTYATPQPALSWMGEAMLATNEMVVLEPVPELLPGALLQNRLVTRTNGLRLEFQFYWPKEPTGTVAGYTAPLVRFVETRITGLTTQPVVLTNYYSQTYRPGHHNFTEEFIFEPRLDPGVPASALAELQAANIQWIYVQLGFGPEPDLRALGFDGKFRDL